MRTGIALFLPLLTLFSCVNLLRGDGFLYSEGVFTELQMPSVDPAASRLVVFTMPARLSERQRKFSVCTSKPTGFFTSTELTPPSIFQAWGKGRLIHSLGLREYPSRPALV